MLKEKPRVHQFSLPIRLVLGYYDGMKKMILASGIIMLIVGFWIAGLAVMWQDDNARLGMKAFGSKVLGFNFDLEAEYGRPTVHPEDTLYLRPTIGMSLGDFDRLCPKTKEWTRQDNFREYKSARSNIITVVNGWTEDRSKKDCDGTFTFVDYHLDSISR